MSKKRRFIQYDDRKMTTNQLVQYIGNEKLARHVVFIEEFETFDTEKDFEAVKKAIITEYRNLIEILELFEPKMGMSNKELRLEFSYVPSAKDEIYMYNLVYKEIEKSVKKVLERRNRSKPKFIDVNGVIEYPVNAFKRTLLIDKSLYVPLMYDIVEQICLSLEKEPKTRKELESEFGYMITSRHRGLYAVLMKLEVMKLIYGKFLSGTNKSLTYERTKRKLYLSDDFIFL